MPNATEPARQGPFIARERTCRRRHACVLVAVVLLGVMVTSRAGAAQTVRVPLDVMSGPVLNAAGPGAPFAGAVRGAVTADLGGGRARLGLAGAALYTGGDWKGAGGVRGGMRLAGVLDVGLFAYGEALFGHRTLPLSLGLLAELPVGVSLRTGLWATRDTEAERTVLALVLGTDLDFWLRRRGPPPPRRPGDVP